MPIMVLQVIARIRAKPESVDTVRAILGGIVEPTRREPGCVHYRLLQHLTDPTEFATMEEWISVEAEEAHFFTPHILNALSKLSGHLAAEPDIRRYQAVV